MSKSKDINAQFTKQLLHPRYWLTWFGIGMWYVIVQLPYPIIYQLGKLFGLFAFHFMKKRRKTALQNLILCFPDMPEPEREKLLRENFISTGLAVFETGMAWFWSRRRLKKHIKIVGNDYINQINQSGQGILLVGIHFLTLELGGRILGMNRPGVAVYRPNDNLVLDYIQIKGRLKSNKYLIDRHNTKGMIRALKKGEIVWYAPDHDYGRKNTVFAPFFAVEKAATTVGTTILVKLGQPVIIPFIPKRESNGIYTVYVSPPLEHFSLENEVSTATRMNKVIEEQILKAPEQYMWLHRRFKTRPLGEEPLYSKDIQKRKRKRKKKK